MEIVYLILLALNQINLIESGLLIVFHQIQVRESNLFDLAYNLKPPDLFL